MRTILNVMLLVIVCAAAGWAQFAEGQSPGGFPSDSSWWHIDVQRPGIGGRIYLSNDDGTTVLTGGETLGLINFYGRWAGGTNTMARIQGYYAGDGSKRIGYLGMGTGMHNSAGGGYFDHTMALATVKDSNKAMIVGSPAFYNIEDTSEAVQYAVHGQTVLNSPQNGLHPLAVDVNGVNKFLVRRDGNTHVKGNLTVDGSITGFAAQSPDTASHLFGRKGNTTTVSGILMDGYNIASGGTGYQNGENLSYRWVYYWNEGNDSLVLVLRFDDITIDEEGGFTGTQREPYVEIVGWSGIIDAPYASIKKFFEAVAYWLREVTPTNLPLEGGSGSGAVINSTYISAADNRTYTLRQKYDLSGIGLIGDFTILNPGIGYEVDDELTISSYEEGTLVVTGVGEVGEIVAYEIQSPFTVGLGDFYEPVGGTGSGFLIEPTSLLFVPNPQFSVQVAGEVQFWLNRASAGIVTRDNATIAIDNGAARFQSSEGSPVVLQAGSNNTNTNHIDTYVIVDGGSGYTEGDSLYIESFPFGQVATVDAGVITAIDYFFAQYYITNFQPFEYYNLGGGSGTGARIYITGVTNKATSTLTMQASKNILMDATQGIEFRAQGLGIYYGKEEAVELIGTYYDDTPISLTTDETFTVLIPNFFKPQHYGTVSAHVEFSGTLDSYSISLEPIGGTTYAARVKATAAVTDPEIYTGTTGFANDSQSMGVLELGITASFSGSVSVTRIVVRTVYTGMLLD